MSSSYITYQGRGFGAKDGGIEIWFAALGHEIGCDAQAPDWLKEIGDYWRHESVECCGCFFPHLEEQLDERGDIGPLITAAELAVRRLESLEAVGEMVSYGTFGQHSDKPYANEPIRTRNCIEVGRAFVDLLRGNITADDYPYPFVTSEGLHRSPRVPRGPQLSCDDRQSRWRMQLPVESVEKAKEAVSALFGITFRKPRPRRDPIGSRRALEKNALRRFFGLPPANADPTLWSRFSYVSLRDNETFMLYQNGDAQREWVTGRFPRGAIMLEIETSIARGREYERRLRSHFGSLSGRVHKVFYDSSTLTTVRL